MALVAPIAVHAEVTRIFGSAAEDVAAGRILTTADLGVSPEQLLFSTSAAMEGIDLDVAGGKIYFLDNAAGQVRRANLDGSSPQTLVSSLGDVSGIGLDLVNGKVYYGDDATNTIRRANLDGSSPEIVVSDVAEPVDIAIDAVGGKVYWVDLDGGLVERANLNGSNVETVFSGSPQLGPVNVALDLTASKVYFTDLLVGIWRADLDGSNPVLVVPGMEDGVSTPTGLALDVPGGKMYWTDFTEDYIRRSNLDGSMIEEVFIPSAGDFNIAFDSTNGYLYWEDDINVNTGVRRQAIPDVDTIAAGLLSEGPMTVHGSHLYYVDTDIINLSTGGGSIHRSNFDGSGDVTLASDLTFPYDIEIDAAGGKMYWSDVLDGIFRANLNGTGVEVLFDASFPTSLEIDIADGKVYWVAADTLQLLRANLDGTGQQVIFNSVNFGEEFAIHHGQSKLYFIEEGVGIRRSNLDGTSPETLVSAVAAGFPESIELDVASAKMYWSDAEDEGIKRANLDGSGVETIIGALFPVGPIALATGKLAQVFVDFAFTGFETGAQTNPFNSLAEALSAVQTGGTITLNGASADTISGETPTISNAVTITATGGSVRIGQIGGGFGPNKKGFIAPRMDD